MNTYEVLMVSLNIAILTLFYTALGGTLSFVLDKVFTQYSSDWIAQSTLFKITEVSAELIVLGLVSFWATYIIEEAPPIFPVSRKMDNMVDTYISGVFFVYAIFLFFDSLWEKVKHLSDLVKGLILRKNGMTKKEDTTHQS